MITTSTDISVVAAQLTGWSLLLLLGDTEAVITTPHLIAIVGVGLSLLIVSALQLGRSYSSSTRPRASSVLVRRGVYRYLRHPIYTGLLIVSLAFFLSRPTLVVGTAYLLLALVTNVRAGIEERMLEERYPEYAEYRGRTERYLPFLV
jgi:protein-S-isoprenylcysteine O-methyltransferase Ste14